MWTSEPGTEVTSEPRPVLWKTDSNADVAEWQYRTSAGRRTRTAVFLRGRQMALLAELAEGPVSEHGARFNLAPGVKAGAVPGRRAFRLTAGPGAQRACCRSGCPACLIPRTAGRSR